MFKKQLIYSSLAIILLFMSFAGHLEAAGLSTQLGEVVIENLQVGQNYNLKDLANLRLPVTNKSDDNIHLKLVVLVPEEIELRHEAKPIPSESWIELSDSLVIMGAGETIEADIIIQIPDDDSHLGKKYQFMIWSHTVPGNETGMFLACGLKSRIIFTVDPVNNINEKQTNKVSTTASFQLEPALLTIEKVPIGERYDIGSNNSVLLKLTNTSTHTHTFRLRSQTVSDSKTSLTPGYMDTPDASYLSFVQDELTLEPGQVKELSAYLNFPNNNNLRGGKYMFIVHVLSVTDEVSTGKYIRVFVNLS